MKDFDILDRKYTTVSPVQTVLALMALAPLAVMLLHHNPAIKYWYGGQFRDAVLIAIAWPASYTVILGLLFPLISAWRDEMNRRALLATLAIFGTAAVLLLINTFLTLPDLLQLHPATPGSTRWIGFIQGISFRGMFAGYAVGFTLGSAASLMLKRQ